MTLFKRHIGRRVVLVGVGVALLMLGLEAPAFAVTPTVASFLPASGPVGCVVVVTGTNFTNPAVTEVRFNGATGTIAPDFVVQSDTELWVTVPAGAANGPIRVTNASGGADSAGGFTVSPPTSAGGCAPAVTSFTPPCASPGDTVKITGTNLLRSADPATTQTEVRFADYATTVPVNATHTIPNAESPTTLSVLVPSGAADGPIRVTTFTTTGGQAFSATLFQTPPPDCPTGLPTTHARSVSLSLRKHLVARGKVSVGDGFTDCAASVPVKIQHRVSGRWKTVGSTTTTATGAYNKRIRDRAGKYRAKAPSVSLGTPVTDICSGATSPVRRVS
jgi:hypothetical protein